MYCNDMLNIASTEYTARTRSAPSLNFASHSHPQQRCRDGLKREGAPNELALWDATRRVETSLFRRGSQAQGRSQSLWTPPLGWK